MEGFSVITDISKIVCYNLKQLSKKSFPIK
nr:MAG TPA: hypothetical protein [Caudoviricetes sp.]